MIRVMVETFWEVMERRLLVNHIMFLGMSVNCRDSSDVHLEKSRGVEMGSGWGKKIGQEGVMEKFVELKVRTLKTLARTPVDLVMLEVLSGGSDQLVHHLRESADVQAIDNQFPELGSWRDPIEIIWQHKIARKNHRQVVGTFEQWGPGRESEFVVQEIPITEILEE
jgi:hypothetical protein